MSAMKAIQEQLSMAQWMNSVERRLTAIEAQHLAMAAKLRELANGHDTTLSGTRVTRDRLRELADLLDGGGHDDDL